MLPSNASVGESDHVEWHKTFIPQRNSPSNDFKQRGRSTVQRKPPVWGVETLSSGGEPDMAEISMGVRANLPPSPRQEALWAWPMRGGIWMQQVCIYWSCILYRVQEPPLLAHFISINGESLKNSVNNIVPFQCSVRDILCFLQDFLDKGNAFSTINVYVVAQLVM